MTVPVYYVAHPVGGDVVANLARARRWFAWLVANEPDVAFCMPWISYVEALPEDEPANRARGLRDDCAMVQGCDGIVLVGGRISQGMSLELVTAKYNSLDVVDLTPLGDEPPRIPCTTGLGARPPLPSRRDIALELEAARIQIRRADIVAKAAGDRIRDLEAELAESRRARSVASADALDDMTMVSRANDRANEAERRIRELEAKLVTAGLREVRDNAPAQVDAQVDARFDVGGEG